MDKLIILVLFLLPIFPLSMVVNKFLNTLSSKQFSYSILVFFIVGNLLLININLSSDLLQFLAVFTIFFYSFRLLGVNNLKTFIMYIYPIISSTSLLWYLAGGNIIEFMFIKVPILASFLALFYFLSNQFSVIHRKSLTGLGNVMPRFSILFIISLMGISSSLLFLGYEILEIELSKLQIVYGIILMISWIFINWSSIRLIEWLIYGISNKNKIYNDLNYSQMITLIILLFTTVGFFIFYTTQGSV